MKIIFTLILTIISLIGYSQCSHVLTLSKTETTCADNDGVIVATVTGGTPPFTYSLDGGGFQPSNTFNLVSSGSHVVIAKDAVGCQMSEPIQFFIPVSITSLTTTATCKDYLAGSINIIAQDGDHTYEYSIDGGTTWTPNTPIQGLDSGSYNFIIRDGTGCTRDSLIHIGYSSIDPIISTISEQCDGTLGSLSVSFPNAGNYNYTINGGLNTVTNPTHTFDTLGGNYSFVVTDDDNCIETVTVEVDIDSIHGQITSQVNETCNYVNGSVVILAPDGVSPVNYSIDNGGTFQSTGSFQDLDNGIYFIKVTDGRSCEYIDTLEVLNEGGVVLNLSIDTIAICYGKTIDITSSTSISNCNYEWSNSLGVDTSITVTPQVTSDYSLIVTDSTGCMDTAIAHVVINPIPDVAFSIGFVNLCPNDSVLITATGADSYSWTTGETTSSIYLKQPYTGDYIIASGVSLGCPDKDSLLVNKGGVIAQITQDQNICQGESTTLVVNSTGNNLTYDWSAGSSNNNTQNVTPNQTTTYQVIVTDFATCSDTVETTVSVDTPTNLEVSPTSVLGCIGEEITLTVSGATDYLWNSNETTETINFMIEGNETISVFGENGSCNENINIQVVAKPSPNVVASSNTTTINTGESITFFNTGSNASYTEWNFNDGTSTTVMDSPTHTFDFQGAYNVVLTGFIGQCADMDTLLVYVGTVGLEETKYNLSIYPNPTSGILNLNLNLSNNEDVSIAVYNINGQIVRSSEIDNSSEVILSYNLSNLVKGIYFVNFRINNESFTKKVILN